MRTIRADNIFSLLDDIFSMSPLGILNDSTQTPRQLRELASASFPPANISVSDSKDYIIEIALAGVAEEDITLTTENRYITLNAKMPEKTGARLIQGGIRSFTEVTSNYFVHRNWDLEKANVTYKNGLLTIVVPPIEEVKRLNEKKTLQITA